MKYVTIWSKSAKNCSWVIDRTHSIEYARHLLGNAALSIGETIVINGRIYAIFNEGFNPRDIVSDGLFSQL